MVLVIGFMGSPRVGGNTDALLDAALDGASQAGARTEKVILEGLRLRGCLECESCLKTGRCAVKDDMDRIYHLLDDADVVIVASPIFFSGLTAQTKMMIDRCQCLWARKYVLGKQVSVGRRRVGAFLSVGGRGNLSFTGAISVVKTFFLSIDVEYAGELTIAGIEGKGGISNHPTALGEARDLGSRLVEMVKRP